MNTAAQFQDAIRAAGLQPPDKIRRGRFERFSTNGRPSDDAGYCLLFDDGNGGVYGDYRSGLEGTWQVKRERPFTAGEREAFRRKVEEERTRREAEAKQRHAEAAKKAAAIWKAARPASADHSYISRKRIPPVATLREIDAGAAAAILGYAPKSKGELLFGRLLVAPVKVGDAFSTLELIDGDGRKSAAYGGVKAGGYWAAQPLPQGDGDELILLIGEGVATALSAKESSGHPAIAALSAGNLPAVAKAMRERYPAAALVILADLVKATGEADPHAIEAARAVGALMAIPNFGTDRPEGASDFNDLHQAQGLKAVGCAVASASAPAREVHQPDASNATAGDPADTEWPEPLPLVAKVEPEPYPIDALPATIRAAVEEVQGFTKAPNPLVASSALAAVSLAIQAHADVKRAEKLTGPTSLFLLTIADSGERKSTCDGFFTMAIREYERDAAELAKPAVARHIADLEAWNAKRDGIKAKIRDLAKADKPTERQEAALRELEEKKPTPPRVPKLLRGDETPENLAFVLACEWPSAGVASSEAGAILGAHGMGKDSIMRNLSLLNILWENGTLSIGRRTSRSFAVRGARLTVALQIQEPTLRSFFDRSQGLARGTGFLARFLVAWPESTQGFRVFTEAPPTWPALAAFNRRIAAILGQPVPIGDDGALSPALLSLAPDAKAAWIAFHNVIEAELRTGGELYDVRDVASKTADNAVRLAALFQVFEHGMGGAVGRECFEGASRIAAWHLNESRRFFGELALPVELANAARLDSWLIDYCRRERTHIVPRREVQRCGPNGLRAKAALSEALRELAEAWRIREVHEARRKEILVNPALLTGGAA